eukprot:1158010-Pelagomonas_calceolata.AAC.2
MASLQGLGLGWIKPIQTLSPTPISLAALHQFINTKGPHLQKAASWLTKFCKVVRERSYQSKRLIAMLEL